jgi:uncharacterized RDD family membrane protein YckC
MASCPNHPSEYDVRPCTRCGRSFCNNCVVLLRGAYYCVDCKIEQLRDVASGSAGSRLEYASVGRRFGAIFIDGVIQGCISWVFILPVVFAFVGIGAFSSLEKQKEPPPAFIGAIMLMYGVALFFSLAVPVVYEGLMLQKRGGQTLGKMALGLKVVTADGSDISAKQAWGRAAMRLAISFFCAPVDYVPAFFDDEKKCLHDMVANTRVVRIQL